VKFIRDLQAVLGPVGPGRPNPRATAAQRRARLEKLLEAIDHKRRNHAQAIRLLRELRAKLRLELDSLR
jgi:hypothetical protein